ncbi:hypothetical protein NEIMUCOT_06426 [Neisseria mucosa ATCC 25996]|uniref:Uncharacterized protein n=1 Tax=Neisseria mucosa (strain ATCC 25996 / DSM 4631 / NCTC 10774 / M26) TaxID=546266 RepID=D3A0J0_NEIM2|nr:hypothetical protein NEIMUCOT_06426 [Neisseria mucosa ATCC 25996]
MQAAFKGRLKAQKAALHFSDDLNRHARLTKPNILNHLTVLLAPAGIYVYRFQSAIL